MMPILVHGNIEKALKQVRRQSQRFGLFKEVRERSAFVSPSELRQRKRANKMRRIRKFQRNAMM
jgi:small subunit ribosomal protein S21